MSRGLLTHLADRFVTQREDLATEALLFVLHESPNARAEVVRLLNDLGCSIEGSALFRSQATGDGGERPDLVGVIDGAERLLFPLCLRPTLILCVLRVSPTLAERVTLPYSLVRTTP